MLLTFDQVSKYLGPGCTVASAKPIVGAVMLPAVPLGPHALSLLATREELTTWLTRLLFHTILPGCSPPSIGRIMVPNNLIAFIMLLLHLQRVGYPAHWLAGFLQDILSGRMKTDVALYRGKWPITLAEQRRCVSSRVVRLDPWLVDFETGLISAKHALPFAVALPRTFAREPSDISLWQAPIIQPWPCPDNSPVMNLLFFNPSSCRPGAGVLKHLFDIFEGDTSPPAGSFFIATALDFYEPEKTKVMRWWMSRDRMAEMNKGGWYVLPFRSDLYMPGTTFS